MVTTSCSQSLVAPTIETDVRQKVRDPPVSAFGSMSVF
jgi:hypothetical protein